MFSFRKRRVQKPIFGTLTSPKTGQIITSTGNLSLDALFGGGLPIGSLCLIEEDKYVTYSRVLAKYFLAEGIVSRHTCFFGSLDEDPQQVLRKLPKLLPTKEAEIENSEEIKDDETNENGLRIAWRYKELPIVTTEQKNLKIGHHFNLMEHMDELILHHANTIVWNDNSKEDFSHVEDEDEITNLFESLKDDTEAKNGLDSKQENEIVSENQNEVETDVEATETSQIMDQNIFHNPKYFRILQKLQPLLSSKRFKEGERGKKYLCRVCITSLGSPLWYDDCFAKDILKFLTMLRSMIRNTVSVCLITMPLNIISEIDKNLVQKIRNLVDYAVELESFAGSEKETNNAYKEYNGFFQLRKVTALNTLSAYLPETTDLAFKLRRKNFVIEKLHLPPEFQDNSDSGKKSAEVLPVSNCNFKSSPIPKVELDF